MHCTTLKVAPSYCASVSPSLQLTLNTELGLDFFRKQDKTPKRATNIQRATDMQKEKERQLCLTSVSATNEFLQKASRLFQRDANTYFFLQYAEATLH